VPLIFHNLRGYDSHLIIKEAWRLVRGDIDAIPNSNEKLMSFKIGKLRCIDSYQFLGCSLEKLVENLHGDSEDNRYDNFIAMKENILNTIKCYVEKDSILMNGLMVLIRWIIMAYHRWTPFIPNYHKKNHS
jgi:hypothetical protein